MNGEAAYAELSVASNFSFLEGASHPEELMVTAAALGLEAIAITDRNSLAGVVRAHVAAGKAGIRLIVGARLDFRAGEESEEIVLSLLAFPVDRAAYGRLSRLITLGRRRAPKGECHLFHADLADYEEGLILLALPPAVLDAAFAERLAALARRRPVDYFLAAAHRYRGDDAARLVALAALGQEAGAPLVACNDVHYHVPGRRALQDVLTAIRHHTSVAEAGWRLAANAERHLKPPAEMARLFAAHPDAISRAVEIAARCRFRLDELRYEYPAEPVPAGETAQSALQRLTWEGARERYGEDVPERVRAMLAHELALIGELDYAPYFLTVHDLVRFARSRGILCQGRGSAANSAVCYCLAITAVDPSRLDLLFERFISAERGEPPDIDVDFAHERREEVIQYVYAKYGRDRAGLAATVISYRGRGAIREVGKAMGLSEDVVGALARNLWGRGGEDVEQAERVRELGLDPDEPTLAMTLRLAASLIGFPRHLSQHVGGFVITRGPLSEVVPVENAAMADRTVIEWDKDDLSALGMLKIDILGLGMLTCIDKGLALLARHHGLALDLAGVPAEDPAVYDMLCRADSIGVFQVESRAQMTMLPRLRPRDFYDLVVEVAIVRPGPIQGEMVHPYLRRRAGKERVVYPSAELEAVLGKTLGVPLFQEQAMRIAIVAAGFTPSEADQLRRAMATFRRTGTIHTFQVKMIEGMVARGYERDFATRCFKQIEGFGEYGFPESHAASFALLVYVSAWMKCHYPAVFACALLNSQPMGFYAPAQIVRDAAEHGVEVRPVDVGHSDWDNTLEDRSEGHPALRLGFRQVKGLKEEEMRRLAARRGAGWADIADMKRRAEPPLPTVERLARADAFRSLGLDRRRALWAAKALERTALPLFEHAERRAETPPRVAIDRSVEWLPEMPEGQQVIEDYRSLRLSLKAHPLSFIRRDLAAAEVVTAEVLNELPAGRRVKVAGLVLVRQRPGSARGVIFATLEDETGVANVIVRPPIFERYRRIVLGARLLLAEGRVEREGIVVHVLAERLVDRSDLLERLAETGVPNPPLEPPVAPADVVKHPMSDPRTALPGGRNFR